MVSKRFRVSCRFNIIAIIIVFAFHFSLFAAMLSRGLPTMAMVHRLIRYSTTSSPTQTSFALATTTTSQEPLCTLFQDWSYCTLRIL